jgi:hypothetical protein
MGEGVNEFVLQGQEHNELPGRARRATSSGREQAANEVL